MSFKELFFVGILDLEKSLILSCCQKLSIFLERKDIFVASFCPTELYVSAAVFQDKSDADSDADQISSTAFRRGTQREHVHMMSALGGGTPKAHESTDKLRECGTRRRGGPKIRKYCRHHVYMPP